MKASIYCGKSVKISTVLLWKDFFTHFFPGIELSFVNQEDLLCADPNILLFPGGSARAFSNSLGSKKKLEILEWVERGGFYIGVCAGGYLASNSYSWSLGLIPVEIKKPWRRGHHQVDMFYNGKPVQVDYFNGPIFCNPGESVRVLSEYGSLLNLNISEEKVPAILYSQHKRGKVLVFSPHLEKRKDTEQMLAKYIQSYLDDK